jgi:hypothetical protein
MATEAVRRAKSQGSTARVTVMPIVLSLTGKTSQEEALHFDSISIVTYR